MPRQEIPEINAEAATTFNWRAFVNIQHPVGINLLLETTATLDLKNPEFRATPFTSIEVNDDFSLDLSVEILRDEGEIYTQTIIAGKYSF